MSYQCSVCGDKVAGDLVTFKDHTEKHIVDLVKHDHPDWAEKDGICRKCYEYYKQELQGTIFKDAPCALRKRKVTAFFQSVSNFFKPNKN